MTVDCYREECPPLTACLHAEAIRPNPLACCKVCPTRDETSSSVSKVHPVLHSDPHKLNDMAMARTGRVRELVLSRPMMIFLTQLGKQSLQMTSDISMISQE